MNRTIRVLIVAAALALLPGFLVGAAADEADAAYEEGARHLGAGEYREAIAAFDRAIARRPTHARAYRDRGYARVLLEEYDLALDDLDEAVSLDPQDPDAINRRGIAYWSLGLPESAIEDYDEALRIAPDHWKARHNRGLCRYYLGDYDGALADYAEAARLNPELQAAQTAPAFILFSRGEYAEAGQVGSDFMARFADGPHRLWAALIGYFAFARAGTPAEASRLLAAAAAQGGSEWPAPVVRYLRREIDAAALQAAATNLQERTEARIYIALDLIACGHTDEALPHLRWATDEGFRNLEWVLATYERARLEGRPR